MVSRQTDKDQTTTRVYKYGIVPIGAFPESAIEELYRQNQLWNKLVELDRGNLAAREEERCKLSADYAEIYEKLLKWNADIKQAYDDKRTARMKAGTKDASHPLIMEANSIIDNLKEGRKTFINDEVRPLRIEIDKIIRDNLEAARCQALPEYKFLYQEREKLMLRLSH